MDNLIYILSAIGLGFLGLKFLKNRSNKKDIKKEVEYKVNDERLKQKQKIKESKLLELQKKYEEARKRGEELTVEEIEDYWNEDN